MRGAQLLRGEIMHLLKLPRICSKCSQVRSQKWTSDVMPQLAQGKIVIAPLCLKKTLVSVDCSVDFFKVDFYKYYFCIYNKLVFEPPGTVRISINQSSWTQFRVLKYRDYSNYFSRT